MTGNHNSWPGVDPVPAASVADQTGRHPCFSFDAHLKYARMHLPVAPRCNISCNYCNRKFDCVNESRPGVASEILNPGAALKKFNLVRKTIKNLSVIGIAGPGDALANWEDTKRSIQLIKAVDPGIVFCLSTNGLMLPDYGPEIVDLGVNHVTVTVNSLDPDTGARIYKHVHYQGRRYEGREGARILIDNQLAGIESLAGRGAVVKVNIVMIKGVNDRQIPDVVRQVKEAGAFITNIMPLIPAPGSAFENLPRTGARELSQMRDLCRADLRQMDHCRQCRADAIGLLGSDRSREFSGCNGSKGGSAAEAS
ncbi:MAG: nitrogenase cofactor biosynthesis protein NifB [Bacillota bacterium]